jgi:Spy/CpxP family protein refolding chaperone
VFVSAFEIRGLGKTDYRKIRDIGFSDIHILFLPLCFRYAYGSCELNGGYTTMPILKPVSRFLLLATVVTLLPIGAFADEHYHTKEQHDAESQKFLTAIDATPEQRKQFEEHHKQYEQMVNPVRTELYKKKQALIEYLASPKPDKKTALKMQGEVDVLQEKMNRFYIDHVFTKRAFVKPEQEAVAETFYKNQVENWKQNNPDVSSNHSHGHTH